MRDVAVIILAAGLSRRMGKLNKLLQSVDGMPLVLRVVHACKELSHYPIIVVTGHQQPEVQRALAGEPVQFVENLDYEKGQMTSVDAGLRAAPQAQVYVLMLGDQPDLTSTSLAALLAAHEAEANGRITVPFVDGVRGNPIIIPAVQRAHMLADPINLGCRKLTRDAPERVHIFASDDRGFITDIDTPDDLALMQERA